MKEKIKSFLIEKKDLLLFIGILSVVFVGVLTIANLAIEKDIPVVQQDDQDDENDQNDQNDQNDENDQNDQNEPTKTNFIAPILNEYEIVRTFFGGYFSEDVTDAIIVTGESMETSKGVSYANVDNTSFDVLVIHSGKVTDIKEDEIKGKIVTVDHGNNVISIYSSLESVNVEVDQELETGQKIGVAGSNLFDNQAGVHVHLQVLVDSNYVDPRAVMGKTIEDLSTEK